MKRPDSRIRNSFVLLVAVLMCLLFGSQPAYADQDVNYDRSYEWFGVRIGYMEIENMEDDGSLNLGFTAGYRLNEPLGIEFSLDYHSSEFSEIDRTTYAFQASLMLYLAPPTAHLQPYVLGGGGYYMSGYDYFRDGVRYTDFTSREFGGHLGAGLDIWMGENASVTLDVRYLFISEDAPGMDNVDGLLATFGTKFRF